MRSQFFFWWFLLGSVVCQAQTVCDSLYAREEAWTAGKIGLIWFDQPPQIAVGKETLSVYNVPKDQVGVAYCRVLIDEHGQALCLQWLKVTNEAIRREANAIVSALRFSPAMINGTPLRVSMTLPVRFLESPAPTRKGWRKSRREVY